jgi:hypothetical protein
MEPDLSEGRLPRSPASEERILEAEHVGTGHPWSRCTGNPRAAGNALGCGGGLGRLGHGFRLVNHGHRIARRSRGRRLRCHWRFRYNVRYGRGRNDGRLICVEHHRARPSMLGLDPDRRVFDFGTGGPGGGLRLPVPADRKQQRQQDAAGVDEVPAKGHGTRPVLSPRPPRAAGQTLRCGNGSSARGGCCRQTSYPFD